MIPKIIQTIKGSSFNKSGIMNESVYDPTGKHRDAFQYADGVTITGVGTETDPFVASGAELEQVIIDTQSTGQISGGQIIPIGGTHFNVLSGTGYIQTSTEYKKVVWNTTYNLQTVANGENSIYVDINGTVFCSGTINDYLNHIQLGVIFTGAGNTQIIELINSPITVSNFPRKLLSYQQYVMHALIAEGLEVFETEGDPMGLTITSGTAYMDYNRFPMDSTNIFTKMVLTSNYGWVPYTENLNHITAGIYNDITKPYGQEVVIMNDTWWKKSLLFRTVSGNVFLIAAQAQYQTKNEALNAPLPLLPPQIDAVVSFLCVIVNQKEDTSIASRIIDIRPYFPRIFQDTEVGAGMPSGGNPNQFLQKIDYTDFNAQWVDLTAHGLTQEVQFNYNGAFYSDANLKYDNANHSLLLGGAIAFNNNPLAINGDVDNFLQIDIQNKNSGVNVSSDLVATSDTGDDTQNFINVGIVGSMYNPVLSDLWNPLDSYLYADGGNVTVGTETAGKNVLIHTGGSLDENVRAIISDTAINASLGVKIQENGFSLTDLITTAANANEEALKFASGSKIVIRTDLL